jgi:hypothetical protein
MDAIIRIAQEHDLWVVEDAAEAHGAEHRGRKVGSIGKVGMFSFYGNKIVSTGEAAWWSRMTASWPIGPRQGLQLAPYSIQCTVYPRAGLSRPDIERVVAELEAAVRSPKYSGPA